MKEFSRCIFFVLLNLIPGLQAEDEDTLQLNESTSLNTPVVSNPVVSVRQVGPYLINIACHGADLVNIYFQPCRSTQECEKVSECLADKDGCGWWYNTMLGRRSTGYPCCQGFNQGGCLNVVPPVPEEGLAICLSRERAVVKYVVQRRAAGGRKKWSVSDDMESLRRTEEALLLLIIKNNGTTIEPLTTQTTSTPPVPDFDEPREVCQVPISELVADDFLTLFTYLFS